MVIVVHKSQRKTFLIIAHDDMGYQGIDCTMEQLSEVYWVGMGKGVRSLRLQSKIWHLTTN